MILNKILDEKSCCCDNFIDLHTVSTIDSCNTIMGFDGWIFTSTNFYSYNLCYCQEKDKKDIVD